MKLEPTAAQMEAVSDYIDRFRASAEYKSPLVIAQEIFAALNSIPDGAPVGTIARRPDGAWSAERWMNSGGELYWDYRIGPRTGVPKVADPAFYPGRDDADSWPVIYDPTKPELKSYPYAEGDTIVIGPECFQVPSKGAIAWKGVWYFDPDYQLNWFPPGEEPLVPRPDPTAQQEPVTARFSGVFTGTCMACQREQCDCHDNNDTPKPRTPRVVDRLGVDEQDAEWMRRGISRDSYVWEYRFCNEVWQVRLIGNEEWASMSPGTEPTDGPFTEVLP